MRCTFDGVVFVAHLFFVVGFVLPLHVFVRLSGPPFSRMMHTLTRRMLLAVAWTVWTLAHLQWRRAGCTDVLMLLYDTGIVLYLATDSDEADERAWQQSVAAWRRREYARIVEE